MEEKFETTFTMDEATRRKLMVMIDQTIAENSRCTFCEGSVELETSPADQEYQAWLRCTNPACQRRRKIT